jgi:hypothetical protein
MEPDMTKDPKPPGPGLEYDRRTPLSRLRYKDTEVQTWQIVVAVVVILAMLALMGFALMRFEAQHSGRRTTGESITVVIQSTAIFLSHTR